MTRTTIMLPEDLKLRAQETARRLGVSLGELIRDSLESRLDVTGDRQDDPLFRDVPIYDGEVPSDLSEEHDRYLYGEEG
ncbi:MAG: CopG family transcriptional regulator [bacterium]